MNPLVLKAAPYALAVLLATGLVAGFAAHERQVGRLAVELRDADSRLTVAEHKAAAAGRRATIDSSRAAHLEADTARANATARAQMARLSALVASYSHAKAAVDSEVAQPHDSAATGLLGAVGAYERVADSTVRACQDAVTADAAALAACQAHGQALQATLTDTRAMVAALVADTVAQALRFRIARQAAPSWLATWGWRLASFGLGALAARIGR